MKAADVMVSNVISVGPQASVQEVADLLLRNRISAAPVIGPEGELVGIVSEGDLMRRPEVGTERRQSWWLSLLTSSEAMASDYIKSHSRKVVDVMTRRVVTATPDTPVGDIATLLEKHGIKRVPIVAEGKVVGIVSRANLLQALASVKNMPRIFVQVEGDAHGNALHDLHRIRHGDFRSDHNRHAVRIAGATAERH
jgi:CBS domain-containing protein